MRLLLSTTALLGLAAAPATAETFANQTVEIRRAAAVLTVIPEDRADIDVSIAPGARLDAPTARVANGRLVIDGGFGPNRIQQCSDEAVGIRGIGRVPRAQLPQITIRTPRTVDLQVGGAVFATVGPSAGGDVALNGCGDIDVADASGDLDLALNGSGDLSAGRVGGDVDAALNGSGGLRVETVGGDLDAALNGSGNLTVGDVTGEADAALMGSGSLRFGTANGDVALALMGSGDINTGAITGSLEAALQGSGSVDVASVLGQSAELDLQSSGNLTVRGGRVETLRAENASSGNISFRGAAGATRAAVRSSGDIDIAEAGRIDAVTDTGSGSIRFGS